MFESVQELTEDTFDIFLVSESKLDSSFLNDQFPIPGYRVVRKDCNGTGGGGKHPKDHCHLNQLEQLTLKPNSTINLIITNHKRNLEFYKILRF